MAQLSTFRRDLWPSREAATQAFEKSAFYNTWDRRVLKKWIEFGLRDVPTLLFPDQEKPQVTLATSPAQEVFTYLRPNYDGHGTARKPMNRTTHPDVDQVKGTDYPLYRPESSYVFRHLPELRPSVLYIFGGASPVSMPAMIENKLVNTGTDIRGSGGRIEGRVKGITLENIGHLVAMEATVEVAKASAGWIGEEIDRQRKEEMKWQEDWRSQSLKQKQEIDDAWKERLGGGRKTAKM